MGVWWATVIVTHTEHTQKTAQTAASNLRLKLCHCVCMEGRLYSVTSVGDWLGDGVGRVVGCWDKEGRSG